MLGGDGVSEVYDYIVVGAGTAGCLIANRLSADPRNSVLLLEAGGRDNWIWLHIPVGYLYAIGDKRADWRFRTQPVAGLGGRDIAYPRGKVIGGCSAINGMIYMRGQAADYDGWRQLGLAGWGWDDVLPYFLRHEDHHGGSGELHGKGGEWRVERQRHSWEILDAVRDAAAEVGIPKIDDFNRGDNEGSDYFEVNQRRGLRVSAAKAFLKPVLKRKNLRLVTGAQARRLTLDSRRVTGLEYSREGGAATALARREIVLTAGAIGTPHLLELSGIGRPEALGRIGQPVLHALPGRRRELAGPSAIAHDLQDRRRAHAQSGFPVALQQALMGLDYIFKRRGPLTMAPSQLGMFAKSSSDYATANLEFHVQPLSLDKFGEPLHKFAAITLSVCNLRPASRGHVHAGSADPNAAPLIQPNYLSEEEDRRVAADSIRLARKIAAAPALAPFKPEEYLPGAALTSAADLAKAAGEIGTTIFHPVGTAKMGRDEDPMAVVDVRLRARGLAGLRIADASVMPRITSGNTNSPTLMIAEKAAEMMLADAKG